jgi:hypothetical protein
MLRDYALSLTLLALVLFGYTALLFNSNPTISKKAEAQISGVRAEASVKPKADSTQLPVSHD